MKQRVAALLLLALAVLGVPVVLGMAGSTPAAYAVDGTSAGNAGVGNGNQVDAPIQAPINVSCNAIGIIGGAQATCRPRAHQTTPPPCSAHPKCPPCSAHPKCPSPSVTPVRHSPAPTLPVTGSRIGPIAVAGAMLLVIGGVLLAILRPRRRGGA